MMKGIAAISGSCFLFTLIGLFFIQREIFLPLSITCGTVFYHFFMRLLVGWTVNGIFRNRMNYTARWFSPLPFERRLYSFLKVKRWKKHLPTYSPETFSIKDRSLEQLAMATCQAETVHEIIILFSFLPLLLAIPFGELPVFFGTSLLGATVDLLFVMIQRCNRPILVRLIERKKNEIEKTA
jgi:hypothetical protein